MIIKMFTEHSKKIVATYFLSTVLITAVLLFVNNTYTSQATLLPASTGTSSKIGGQIGGLAKLAGVDINNQGDDKSKLALRILKSRDFTLNFIETHKIKQLLLGNLKWESDNNKITIDKEIFTEQSEFKDGVKIFKEDLIKSFQEKLKIEEDDKNGIIKISFTHESPEVAFTILSDLIKDVSEVVREKDIQKINEQNVLLLNKINETSSKEVKDSLYGLYIGNLKSLIFANVNNEYVFTFIDKPSIPEKKSGPLRGLILILWTFAYMFFVIFIVIVMKINREKK